MHISAPNGLAAGNADEVDPATMARAAVGAMNRRDLGQAVLAVRQLLRDQSSRLTAVTVLTDILLQGVPAGGLTSTARVSIPFTAPPGDDQCPKALEMAADLVTAVANGDGELAAPAMTALAGDHGFDLLIVLVRAAATRIETFVGLDGDAGDAYYRVTGKHPF